MLTTHCWLKWLKWANISLKEMAQTRSLPLFLYSAPHAVLTSPLPRWFTTGDRRWISLLWHNETKCLDRGKLWPSSEGKRRGRQERRGDVRHWLSHRGSVEKREVLQYPLHLLDLFFPQIHRYLNSTVILGNKYTWHLLFLFLMGIHTGNPKTSAK